MLWSLGSVAGLEVAGAPFFVAEPEAGNGWATPARLGMPSARVEVFCTEPDAFIARAVAAGADGHRDPIRDHQMPWGIHRQGGFVDPFGHIWLRRRPLAITGASSIRGSTRPPRTWPFAANVRAHTLRSALSSLPVCGD